MLGTGDQIDARWQVRHRIGAGGLGAVFLCDDPQDDIAKAVKVLNVGLDAGGANIRKRVVREAKALQKLNHPNIVKVHAVGEDKNRSVVFLVMDFVPGESLDVVETLPPARVREIAWAVLDSLAHAHAHGVAHRDLKPANILVREGDGAPIVVDWGSAYVPADSRLTRSLDNQGLGLTPQYAPPEALLDPAGADPYLWDVYAVGVLAHVLLTGDATPFGGDREGQVTSTKTLGCLDPGPEVDADLRSLVRLATAPAARHRPAGAEGALDLLRRPADAPERVVPAPVNQTIVAAAPPVVPAGSLLSPPAFDDTLISQPLPPRSAEDAPVAAASATAAAPVRRVPIGWIAAAALLLLGAVGLAVAAGALLLGDDEAGTEVVAAVEAGSAAAEATASDDGASVEPSGALDAAEAAETDVASETDEAVEPAAEAEPVEGEAAPVSTDEAAEAAATPSPASEPAAAPAPVKRTPRPASKSKASAPAAEAEDEEAEKAAALAESKARIAEGVALGGADLAQKLADNPFDAARFADDLTVLRLGGAGSEAKAALEELLRGFARTKRGIPGVFTRGLGQRRKLGTFLYAVSGAGLQSGLAKIVVDAIAVEAPLAARSPASAGDCRTARPYITVLGASAAGRRIEWVSKTCETCDGLSAVIEACSDLR